MGPKQRNVQVLDPRFLLAAYCHGYFPMADPVTQEIRWYSPEPRAIIPLDEFRVPRSLKRTIHRRTFDIRINAEFETVMRECARRPDTWISEEIIRSYLQLRRLGYAHSVESWKHGRLTGGLYGVAIGGAFFGESMFSREPDASKVALVALVERLRRRGFLLLDTQWLTPHLAMFGAREISREQYLKHLSNAVSKNCSFVD